MVPTASRADARARAATADAWHACSLSLVRACALRHALVQELVNNLFNSGEAGAGDALAGGAGGGADHSFFAGAKKGVAASAAAVVAAAPAAGSSAALAPGAGAATHTTVPEEMRNRTVEDVWNEIQAKANPASPLKRRQVSNAAKVQPSLTLEDFLTRAGVTHDDDLPGGAPVTKKGAPPKLERAAGGSGRLSGSKSGASAKARATSPTSTATGSQGTGNTRSRTSKGGNGSQSRGGSTSKPRKMKRGKKEVEGDLLGPGPGRGRKRRLPEKEPDDPNAARKFKRMVANRESAARSRQRRQTYTAELEQQIDVLKEEIERLRKGVDPSARPPPPRLRRVRTL